MSDVVVSVVESTTNVTVTEQDVAVAVTETSVDVSSSTAGIQGASYAEGDPIYVTVRNATGATLPKGTIVYISGSNGNHVQVTPALATSDATSARTLGWLSESIANNASGLCQVEGYLEGLNTQGFTSGNQLYLSGVTAGAFTATKPQAPIHLVYVGVVTKVSAGDGHVFVKVQNGYELDEIHDVQIISVANNDLIKYDSATSLWKNVQPSTLSVGTATYATTSGTAVYSTTSGTAVYATNSGTAVNISGTVSQSQVTSLTTDLAGKASLGTANTFTVGGHVITNAATAVIPLVVRGVASQSANLFQLQSSSSAVVANFTAPVNNVSRLNLGGTDLSATFGITVHASGGVGQVIRGAASQSANLQEWQTSAGSTALYIDSSSRINSTTAANFNGFPAGLAYLGIYASNTVPAAIFRASSSGVQTGDTLQYQNSAGTILGGRNANSQIFTGSTTTIKTAVGGTIQSIATGANPLVTMASAHNLAVGDLVTLASTTSGTYDGTFVIATVPLTTTFTITSALTTGQAGAAGTVSVPAQKSITARSAGTIGAVIRGAASQSANLQEWQNSGATALAKVDSAGIVYGAQIRTASSLALLTEASSGGAITLARPTAALSNPGANTGRLYFRDGTTVGTLKLVVRAGAAGAETTILDNIPQ